MVVHDSEACGSIVGNPFKVTLEKKVIRAGIEPATYGYIDYSKPLSYQVVRIVAYTISNRYCTVCTCSGLTGCPGFA
jgi:hypothetical protein